jgi:hypothetical protein
VAVSTVTVALAGGAGAVVGSILSQGIQWLREAWMVRVEERRRTVDADRETATRREDARREAAKEAREAHKDEYNALVRQVTAIKVLLDEIDAPLREWEYELMASDGTGIGRRTESCRQKVSACFEQIHKQVDDNWPDVQAQLATSGAEKDLMELFDQLKDDTLGLGVYAEPNLMLRLPSGAKNRAAATRKLVSKYKALLNSTRDRIVEKQRPQ